jgi:hypothetical protein
MKGTAQKVAYMLLLLHDKLTIKEHLNATNNKSAILSCDLSQIMM